MFTVYIIVTVSTAVANTYAAMVDFGRPQWVVDNITRWGGSYSWLFPLGVLKAAGALGLLVGIAVPPIGLAAAGGLVLFFVWRDSCRNACSLVLAPFLAIDLPLSGDWVAHFTTCGFVKIR